VNADLMRNLEARYRGSSGPPGRSHYKIFYSPVQRAPILVVPHRAAFPSRANLQYNEHRKSFEYA
jgi:hypothetical protein